MIDSRTTRRKNQSLPVPNGKTRGKSLEEYPREQDSHSSSLGLGILSFLLLLPPAIVPAFFPYRSLLVAATVSCSRLLVWMYRRIYLLSQVLGIRRLFSFFNNSTVNTPANYFPRGCHRRTSLCSLVPREVCRASQLARTYARRVYVYVLPT